MKTPEGFVFAPDYENAAVQSIHRYPAHSLWKGCKSEQQALNGEGPDLMSFSGQCRFALFDNPEQVPEGFFLPEFDESGFATLRYPGAWELQGQGEPIYTNVPYPWPCAGEGRHLVAPVKGGEKLLQPPYVPAQNPTGCYRLRVQVPEHFLKGDAFLRFDGVETAFYLWVNGKPAGFSKDSKLPAEFEVTGMLHEGENLLALEVLRFADSSYLEDQDYWHISGIHRGVFLTVKPHLRIEDVFLRPAFDPVLRRGQLTADVKVSRAEGFAQTRVRLRLFDGVQVVAEAVSAVEPKARYDTRTFPSANTARLQVELRDVSPWEPEAPKLYTAVVTLLDEDGNTLDVESERTGFRSVEVRDGVVLFNGSRLVVRGVNRHDFCWRGGRTVPREHMEREIRLMKRLGINAVRTCHYPDDPAWYELCDEMGLLVVCECDLETHGLMGQLSHDPSWAQAYLERAVRMAQTFKNHVCIYAWSLGNESGTGANHAAMYGFLKEFDPTRLCQYEAGSPGPNVSDVRGNMYATIDQIERLLADPRDTRPIILVEYLYQIRSSGGGLHKLRGLLDKYPRFQGGFVWDWQDKALYAQTQDGRPYFAHGGDFGESMVEPENPPYMTNNGVVLADLTPKPVALELKEAYAPVWVQKPENASAWDTEAEEDSFLVRNDSRVFPLSAYACTAVLRENGVAIAEREVELPDVPPLGRAAFRFSIPHERRPGSEYHLEFVFRLKEARPYAEAGFELGHSQFALQAGPARLPQRVKAPVSLKEEGGVVELHSGELTLLWDAKAPALRLTGRGGKILAEGFTPCLDRPYTGLDAREGWGWFDKLRAVRGLACSFGEAQTLTGENAALLLLPFLLEDASGGQGGQGELTLRMEGGGLHVGFDLTLAESFVGVPRVGLELRLPAGLEALSYFGCGPEESYVDRPLAARAQVVETTVAAQHFPYAPPSENGGHEGTRWLRLSDGAGQGLFIRCDRPLHFDAHHNSVSDYQKALHDHELPARGETWLHLDAAHSPIGSDLAWSTALDGEQALRGGGYQLGFTVEEIRP